MSQATGTQFGKYELLDRIAAGGMAEIFKARYAPAPGVVKPVVIKKILPHYAENKSFIGMFTNEARIAMGLSHGNIAQVFDFGAIDGEYFLAMEFVDGLPLSKLVKRCRALGIPRLPTEFAVYVTSELLKGLHYAHAHLDEQGRPMHIVHRDVSPQNVLVSYGGQVKLVDFGIAKARTAGVKDSTQTATVKGKYAYFAPEQARAKELDARTDIFAAGTVLYELLTGTLPFQGKMMDALSRIVRGQFPRPRELTPSIPPELEAIVLKAMAQEKADRYQTAEAYAQALSSWLSREAPDFSPGQLGLLLQLCFEEELVREGRPVQLPREFVERAHRWKAGPPISEELQDAEAVPAESQDVVAADHPDEATEAVEVPSSESRALEGREDPTRPLPVPAGVAPLPPVRVAPYVESSATRARRAFPWVKAVVLVLAAVGVGFAAVFVAARMSRATLEIVSTPAGALVHVGGVAVSGAAPLTLKDLEGGRSWDVVVTAPGYLPWKNQVPLRRGQHLVVQAELQLEPAPPPPARLPEPPPPPPPSLPSAPPPVPDAVAWPVARFDLDAARHHVDLSRAGAKRLELDPAETYRVSLSKGAATGWGYYAVNPAGAQVGALSQRPLEMKGVTRLFAFRLGAASLGASRDDRKSRTVSVVGLKRHRARIDVAPTALELTPTDRVTLTGLDETKVYELRVSAGTPPARLRVTGAPLATVVVGHPVEGVLAAQVGTPLRFKGARQLWFALLDDQPDVYEGRLALSLVEVPAKRR